MVDPIELANRFTDHEPDGPQAVVCDRVRGTGYTFARLIADVTENSREQSLALTCLEEAVMWTNTAIVRHGLRPDMGQVMEPDG